MSVRCLETAALDCDTSPFLLLNFDYMWEVRDKFGDKLPLHFGAAVLFMGYNRVEEDGT